MANKKVTVVIEIVPGYEHHGSITKKSNNKYHIKINGDDPADEKMGTLFHEFGHLAHWLIINDAEVAEKAEHKFCDKMDAHARRWFAKLLSKD